MQKKMENQCFELLSSSANILIAVHRKPDGDAVGAAFGLAAVLEEAGKNVQVLMPEGFPVKYAPLVRKKAITTLPVECGAFDLVMLLDTARASLAGFGSEDSAEKLPGRPPLMVIDHHPGNDIECCCRLADPSAAAASLLCFETALQMQWQINAEAATLFLLGLSTDTGGFRFSNSDSRAFAAAGKLLELGADLDAVNTNAYFSKPVKQQKLEADMVLNHLQFRANGAVAVGTVTAEMLEQYDFDMRDGDGIIERIREMQGVMAAILISPRGNSLKLSARTRSGSISAAAILEEFGGGGHKYAAGLQINENIDTTVAAVLNRFEEELEKL